MSQLVSQASAVDPGNPLAPSLSVTVDMLNSVVVTAQTTTTLTSTAAGTSANYLRYLYEPPVKHDRVNEPMLLDLALAPIDGSFVKLTRGNYLIFTCQTYPLYWFTGYVTNDPQLEYLGTDGSHNPVFGYRYQITDDTYVLNLQSLGVIPPFVNTSCAAIIKALVDMLDPAGQFGYSTFQPGASIARYVVDPTKKFSDVVKELADMSNYRFRVLNRNITFEPKDRLSSALIIDGHSKHFTPSQLTIQPTVELLVNDVVVVGNIEPQVYMTEYYIGDSATALFSTVASPYGVDSAILLDDDFSGSSIDTTNNWNVFDSPTNYIQVSNGFLNVLGGSNTNTFDVYLQSINLVPVEGQLRLTHGEYDFVNSASAGVNGVICGLWTGAPNRYYTGCIYGVQVSKSGTTTTLNPIVNGVVDTTQSVTINFAERYVLRTLLSTPTTVRFNNMYTYITSGGIVSSVGGTASSAAVAFKTWIYQLNPSTGALDATFEWNNSVSTLPASSAYAYYTPIASNDLHCTFTGVTINTPLLAKLQIKYKGTTFAANTPYQLNAWVRPSVANGLIYKVTTSGTTSTEPVWATSVGAATTSGGVTFTAFLDAYNTQLIGPNEIDATDGTSPIATITDSAQGVVQQSSTLGSPLYNVGNASLAFFKDTARQITYVPQVGDQVVLTYRTAGSAIARVQDAVSIASEAAAWGDSGHRSETKSDLQPQPRNSAECELAAKAYLSDFAYQHFEGSYSQANLFDFNYEPTSGTVLKFQNLPSSFSATLQAETITEVTSTFNALSPKEVINHEIKFGKVLHVPEQLAAFGAPQGVFAPVDSVSIPAYIPVSSVGTTFVVDVTAPSLASFDSSNLNFNTNQAAPAGGGHEVRYTDDSWGADDGKNLVTRTSGQTFAVPRNARGKLCFVRAYDGRNAVLWSEDLTQSVWSKTSATATSSTGINPDNQLSQLSTINFAASGFVSQSTSVPIGTNTVATSFSLKGTAGQQVIIRLQQSVTPFAQLISQTVTMTGSWQRTTITFTGTGQSGNYNVVLVNPSSIAALNGILASRMSLETGTSTETVYCKTRSTVYGALSRFSAGLRVSYPLVPPAPTATIDGTNILFPIVNVILPVVLSDVWGVEVRAADNATVLYHADLSDAGYNPAVKVTNSSGLTVTYWVYTYNLLGEYGTGYQVSAVLNPVGVGAIAQPGINSGKNLLVNPGFELNTFSGIYQETSGGVFTNGVATASGLLLCDGWLTTGGSPLDSNGSVWSGVAVSHLASRNHNGSSGAFIRLQPGASFASSPSTTYLDNVVTPFIPVSQAKKYYLSGWTRFDANATAPAGVTLTTILEVAYYDSSFNFTSGVTVNRYASASDANAGWIFGDTTFTPPAGTAYARVFCVLELINNSGSTFNTGASLYADVAFDDIAFIECSDPSTGEIITKGSIPPSLSTAFTYSSTTTSITWSWASLQILRSDGTVTSPSNGSYAVTGLVSSTAYKFYPYYDEISGSVQFVVGQSGNTGSPAAAYTVSTNACAQQQNLQSRIPLSNGPVSGSTPASGLSSGGDGGSGVCLWHRSVVMHRERGVVELHTCQVGDWILGRKGRWTQIQFLKSAPCDTWVVIELSNGETIRCTPTHHFTLPSGLTMCAGDLALSDFMFTCSPCAFEQISLPVSIRRLIEPSVKIQLTCEHEHDDCCAVECDDGHLFYAGTVAPTILTHNIMPRC